MGKGDGKIERSVEGKGNEDQEAASSQQAAGPKSSPESSLKAAFIAGATGFTGRALAAQDASAFGVLPRLQVRPGSKQRARLQGDPRIVDVDLDDPKGLADAMAGCAAVVQLIGTVKAKFAEDGNYEKVDYGTTKALVAAAKAADVPHFVLLSSVGASTGLGAYLQWKKKTEALVQDSGLPYTLLRPSVLAGDDDFPDRASAANSSAFLAGLSDTPFGAPFALIRPINIQVLARVILHVVGTRGPKNDVIAGANLFRIIRENDLRSMTSG